MTPRDLALYYAALTYYFLLFHRRYDGDMLKVFHISISSFTFWFLTIIIVIVCLIPDCLVIIYNNSRPTHILRRNEEPPQYIDNNNDNDNARNVFISL